MVKRRKPDTDHDDDSSRGAGGGFGLGFGLGGQMAKRPALGIGGAFGNVDTGDKEDDDDGTGAASDDNGEDEENVVFSFMPPSNTSMRRAEFVLILKALNEQFAAWINSRMSGSDATNVVNGVACEIWIDAAKDYIKHAMKIKQDFRDVLESTPSDTKEHVSCCVLSVSLP